MLARSPSGCLHAAATWFASLIGHASQQHTPPILHSGVATNKQAIHLKDAHAIQIGKALLDMNGLKVLAP
jgi:hypothetical protein